MSANVPGSGPEGLLFLLKTRDPQTAARMVKRLGVDGGPPDLAVLAGEKLVDFTDEPREVGRPARLWRLTPKAYDRFPDCHAGCSRQSKTLSGNKASSV